LQTLKRYHSSCFPCRKRFEHSSPAYMVQNRHNQCNWADIFFDTVITILQSHNWMLLCSRRVYLMKLHRIVLVLIACRCPTGAFVSRLMLKRGFILCRFRTTRHVFFICISGLLPRGVFCPFARVFDFFRSFPICRLTLHLQTMTLFPKGSASTVRI
jgi:hypothetical protein